MIAAPNTPDAVAAWAAFAIGVWIKVEQWLNSRKAKQDLDANTVETKATKDGMTTIKAMLNGERLELLKERVDALKVVADYRNAPGDKESYDRALEEYHRLKASQAVLLAEALQAQLRRQP